MSGAPFGTIGSIREDVVRIDAASLQVWVSTEAIFTVEGSIVTLVCERRGLADYVVDFQDGQACA